jgi:hypothetical protein
MAGMPADRSLLSRMAQGSKPSSPSRYCVRTSGSSSRLWPFGSSIGVGWVISGSRRTEAHIQAGLAQDGGELRDVLQVELVARVVLGNQQQACAHPGRFFDGAHRRLHAERQEGRVEVVEAAGKEVGIDRRQLEAGVAQVDRRIEGRRVLLPLAAQPVFDLRAAVEEAALEFEQGAGQGGGQVGNHGLSQCRLRRVIVGRNLTPQCTKMGRRARGQLLENR